MMCADAAQVGRWNNYGAQLTTLSCQEACLADVACAVVLWRPGNGYCTGYRSCPRERHWGWLDDRVYAKAGGAPPDTASHIRRVPLSVLNFPKFHKLRLELPDLDAPPPSPPAALSLAFPVPRVALLSHPRGHCASISPPPPWPLKLSALPYCFPVPAPAADCVDLSGTWSFGEISTVFTQTGCSGTTTRGESVVGWTYDVMADLTATRSDGFTGQITVNRLSIVWSDGLTVQIYTAPNVSCHRLAQIVGQLLAALSHHISVPSIRTIWCLPRTDFVLWVHERRPTSTVPSL
jgi:hypothetical protein